MTPPDSIAIEPIPPFRATLQIPGSKSLTNRALLLAAMARGTSTLSNVLLADDTLVMLSALRQLGSQIHAADSPTALSIQGWNGWKPAHNLSTPLGNAGTAVRFLTAALCLGQTRVHIVDGDPRMRHRPIAQLVDPLKQIGADVRYLAQPGFPPLQITATGLQGGRLTLEPTLSSQYISALLQIAPACQLGLTISFRGQITSKPYVEMTLRLMQLFGAKCSVDPSFTQITIPPGYYTAANYAIEPDASNASYFLAAAAILPGSSCTIQGLGKRSLQGDAAFADVLHQMGASLVFGSDFITIASPPPNQPLSPIDIDLNAMPDMAQTLAVVALFANGNSVIRNIGNLRIKETDRLAALQTELTKLGAVARIDGDDLHIHPPTANRLLPAAIDTYNDHRMAMSFAIAGLRSPGVVIRNPQCVSKTFPTFFEYLHSLSNQSPDQTHRTRPVK